MSFLKLHVGLVQCIDLFLKYIDFPFPFLLQRSDRQQQFVLLVYQPRVVVLQVCVMATQVTVLKP